MSRPPRVAEGGLVYYALNRANARLPIFDDEDDYAAFERTIGEAVTRYDMRLLAYRVMPNHFIWLCLAATGRGPVAAMRGSP